jgi:hypothetical protein
MPQTNVNLTPNPAQPGQPLSNDRTSYLVRCVPAGVVVPFGVLCEVYAASNGQALCRPVQDATTGSSFLPLLGGISMLDAFAVEMGYTTYSVPPSTTGSSSAGYPIGFSVPLVYRGGIWGAWDGNTGTALPLTGGIQVWHSSDGSHSQGVFTTLAAQTTLHQEIDGPLPYITVWDPFLKSGAYTDSFGNVVDIVALQINLPGLLTPGVV